MTMWTHKKSEMAWDPHKKCHSQVYDSGLRTKTYEAEARSWIVVDKEDCLGEIGLEEALKGGADFGSNMSGRYFKWVKLQYFFFPPLSHSSICLFQEGGAFSLSSTATPHSQMSACLCLMSQSDCGSSIFNLCPHLETCSFQHVSVGDS